LQGAIGQAVLERYLALEQEIAEAEKGGPIMVHEQKRIQKAALDKKLQQQTELVSKLESET